MIKKAIWSGKPAAGAPYTPAISAAGTIYVSGQVPTDRATGAVVQGSFEDRARQCILNVESVLKAAGASLDDVVKVTVFLTDMGNFGQLNEVYRAYWGEVKPARSCVAVSQLPMGVDVEIEAIAVVPTA